MKLKISSLKLVPEFYPREGVDEERVKEFAELLKEGVKFDPIKVTKESVVLDGIHRLKAHELAGLDEIEVEIVEDAGKFLLLTAASLNSKHGKPLTNAEKRSVVEKVLAAEPEIELKELANALAVSKSTVYGWTEEIRQGRDERLKQRALGLRGQGRTEREIADEIGVPRQTISDWISAENSSAGKIGNSNGTNASAGAVATTEGEHLTQNVELSAQEKRDAEALRKHMDEVMKLHEQGKTDEEISGQTRFPVKTVSRWVGQDGKVEDGDVENEWNRVFADTNERADQALKAALEKYMVEDYQERKALEADPEYQRRERAEMMAMVAVPLLEKNLECPVHKRKEDLHFECGLSFSDAAKKWKEIMDRGVGK